MIHLPGILNSFGLLVLRLGFGGMMAFGHGLPKLLNAAEMQTKIGDPLNLIPSPYAFYCLVGAEFFAALLVAVGLLTRLGAVGVAYAMGVAAFVAHAKDPLFMTGTGPAMEPALIYLIAFAAIVFTGPGSFSLDRLLFGRPRPQV